MEPETKYHRRPRRRSGGIAATSTTVCSAPPPVKVEKEEDYGHLHSLSAPAGLLLRLVAAHVELVSTALLLLIEPFVVHVAESRALPHRLARGTAAFLRHVYRGLVGAAQVATCLLAAVVLAALIGPGLVRLWAEEPVSVRHPLHFDHTQLHPSANVSLGGAGGRARAVPVGHNVRVSLHLLLPESDYNRRIGVFQITAEVISSGGAIVAASSQPCMLRFRSLPVRLMRTFLLGFPLLIGLCSESQKIEMELLRYKESGPQTEVISVRLKPRAGTTDLPQLYAAEIRMSSRLPRGKELVYNWRWTFYVWVWFYMSMLLLTLLLCCFKPSVLPRRRSRGVEKPHAVEKRYRREGGFSDESSDALKRWRERRRRRMLPPLPHASHPEVMEGSASSTRGETSEVIEDSGDFAASESSECVGG